MLDLFEIMTGFTKLHMKMKGSIKRKIKKLKEI
jgi:hypothetical protein